jgi:hypothetical protein
VQSGFVVDGDPRKQIFASYDLGGNLSTAGPGVAATLLIDTIKTPEPALSKEPILIDFEWLG